MRHLLDPDHEKIETLKQACRSALEGGNLPSAEMVNDACQYICSRERFCFIEEFSYALPTDEAITALVDLSPMVEIGAGTGFWSALVAAKGGDIIATGERDLEKDYSQNIGRYHPVKKVGNAGLSHLVNRNAFLCWPPYGDDLAYRVASRLRPGHALVYVGEGRGGCTADDQFHDYANKCLEPVKNITIPQWGGIHDHLTIYRKPMR